MSLTYGLAQAAFIGGSLGPLGGQNFLEALTCGFIPVIGPSWENFVWVGSEIIERGLVRVAKHWKEAAGILLQDLDNPRSHKEVLEETITYVKDRQGGTDKACRQITAF